MKFKIKAYSLQELGQRANQEDSLFPALGKSTSDDRLFVLCDGTVSYTHLTLPTT